MPRIERHEKAGRVFYGDPDDTDWEAMAGGSDRRPPEDGDELCDGHQMHYLWKDGKWQ
jgi:hypothetical protein